MKFDTADIFRRAHALARKIRVNSHVGTYRAAFAKALKSVWNQEKAKASKKIAFNSMCAFFGVSAEAPASRPVSSLAAGSVTAAADE